MINGDSVNRRILCENSECERPTVLSLGRMPLIYDRRKFRLFVLGVNLRFYSSRYPVNFDTIYTSHDLLRFDGFEKVVKFGSFE